MKLEDYEYVIEGLKKDNKKLKDRIRYLEGQVNRTTNKNNALLSELDDKKLVTLLDTLENVADEIRDTTRFMYKEDLE